MLTQAAALALIALANTFSGWALATLLLGAGTAMVYPTLLAAIGDVAHPGWRARSVGVYRLWRDSGYAAGAVLGGIVADLADLRAAVWAAAALSLASGISIAIACGRLRPDMTRSSRALSNAAESLPPGWMMGKSFLISSPNSGDCSTLWRAFIQFTLPRRVLISPLCAM